jgi:hypothetical protein
VERAADLWGAELAPGAPGAEGAPRRLRLATVSGLRRGWAGGELSVEPLPEGVRLSFRVDEGDAALQPALLVILALGAAGGLLAAAWPFWPHLLAVAPLGGVLALAAWFLVASRQRASGPDEFLSLVAAEVGKESAATD